MTPEKQRILDRVTDPQKVKRVLNLTEDEARIILSYSLSVEDGKKLLNDPELESLRVIWYRNVIDWASSQAEAMYQVMTEFINSPSFVEYSDLLTSPRIMSFIRSEWLNNHSIRLEQLREYEVEIIGARINLQGDIEVLLSHNQIKPSLDVDMPTLNFSQREYQVPPQLTIGLLRENPVLSPVGKGGEMYIAMPAPYFANGVRPHIEVVLPKPQPTTEEKLLGLSH